MKKQMILWTCILLLVLAGCKKDDVQYTDRYELKGKVEKGPFVRGSEVTVYELSERLERTGISYTIAAMKRTLKRRLRDWRAL